MVTMLDVARKAGVSKSTVSRVLSGSNLISAPVTEAVFQAIRETGYRTNLLAQQLAVKKTHLIGFVVTNRLYNGPYFSQLIYKAGLFSEEHGYRIILADGKNSAEDELNAVQFLQDMKCAGIMLYPHNLGDAELTQLIRESTTPIVTINRSVPSHPEWSIVPDHYEAAARMVDFIIAQGHRKIAFISGSDSSPTAIARFNAYRDRLGAHGIVFDEGMVGCGDWSTLSGYQATRDLVARHPALTAILAGNDDMAMGAINALQDSGLKIPEDIAVAGFDNNPMGEIIRPNLTSVRVPLDEMIEKAIFTLLGKGKEAKAVQLRSELIIRKTLYQCGD